jgi:predicted O-methyltransferase YrrM
MLLKDIEKYAKEHNIPIMEHDGIEFLTKYIQENNIINILEIGTAIGYSAIKMSLISDNIHVTTIERETDRYEMAIKNIESFNLQSRIKVIYDDAFNVNLDDTYDLIFIDAAKSQYIKFFEKFTTNLKTGGVVVSDNLNFHGLIDSNLSELSPNVRGIITKLNRYINYLKENKDYKTLFYNIGDGISVSIKL